MNLAKTPTYFSTERLIIKHAEPGFTDALYEAARESIATVYPFLPWCHPDYQRSDAVDWLDQAETNWANGTHSFMIFNAEGTLVGGCGVNRIDQHPVANLGYWIRTSATGRGYATEATRGLANFALTHLGFKRLEIIMATHNEASRQVAIHSGATYEGLLRQRLELHDVLYDAYLYSLISA